jgi:protein-S-isoprenylcysteine O-methyltransferase Ste14
MRRVTFFVYGVVCYLMFLATFSYAIAFVGNVFVPRTIDGEPQSPLGMALLINLGLLTVFAVQHSVMARPAFKRWWTKFVPKEIERSTYVLASNLALILLFVYWEPMGGVIWSVTDPVAGGLLVGLCVAGWLMVLVATFLINHFELLGLSQVWHYLRGTESARTKFQTPALYKRVRHPLYLGFLIAFWATPTMTATHLLFAVMTTGYILVGIFLEERDLAVEHGQKYLEYRKQVPMLVPMPGKRAAAALSADADLAMERSA